MPAETLVQYVYSHVKDSQESSAVRFLQKDGSERLWTWKELWTEAGKCTEVLRNAGLKPGQVCAILFPYRNDICAWYWGIARLGAIPAVLAYPGPRLHPDKFRHGLSGVAKHSGLDVLVTDENLQPTIEPLLQGGTIGKVLIADKELEKATGLPDKEIYAAKPDDAFLLQHSSGTTGLQKAVVLSNQAILNQLESLSTALQLDVKNDVVVSWLPLYHDMGLIAAWLLPFIKGIESVQISPFDWVADPAVFWKALSKCKGTLAWQPNFALNVAADRLTDDDLADLDFSHVKALINCSEPVRASSHDKIIAKLKGNGLPETAVAASYAMAETVFAITQTPIGTKPVVQSVEVESIQEKGVVKQTDKTEGMRRCVSSGRLISGADIMIVDEDDQKVGDGTVGELTVAGSFLFSGYRRNHKTVRENFISFGNQDWFKTGDLGYISDGEVFVIGRKKDLLIIGGKNLYPEDIEDCVSAVEGVIPGRVVAYGEYVEAMGTEAPMILAETNATEILEQNKISREIRSVVQAALEVAVFRVNFVSPRWLVKSSAGKIARKTNVERWNQENN